MTRILCVRSGFAGDICMSTASLRGIKQKHPDAHLTYACWKQYTELIALSPWIDEVAVPGLYMTSSFDKLLDFRHESLMVKNPQVYWGKLHAMQAAELGLLDLDKVKKFRPQIYVGVDDLAEKSEDKPIATINVWSANGIGWRLWDIERWNQLVVELHRLGFKVVQIGAGSDPKITDVDVQLVGQTRLAQAAAVVAVSDLVIAIDSLIAHLAHADKYVRDVEADTIEKISGSTPTVLLAGPIPPECVVPVDANCKVASYYPDCQGPCNHSFASPSLPICEHKNSCMRKLPVELVVQKVEEVVDGSVGRS